MKTRIIVRAKGEVIGTSKVYDLSREAIGVMETLRRLNTDLEMGWKFHLECLVGGKWLEQQI